MARSYKKLPITNRNRIMTTTLVSGSMTFRFIPEKTAADVTSHHYLKKILYFWPGTSDDNEYPRA
jgi:hypothetical protein